MGILERLVPSPHRKVVDGIHPGTAQAPARENRERENRERENRDNAAGAEILPLTAEPGSLVVRRNILIAVSGCDLDQELVSLACQIAREKREKKKLDTEVVAVYGIQVPQTLPIDAEMTDETRDANAALDSAQRIATEKHTPIEPEIIQSRHFGQSLVEEAESHDCALLILGLPYRLARNGRFEMGEVADYVLKNATCRVWIVRGQPTMTAGASAGLAAQDTRAHALT